MEPLIVQTGYNSSTCDIFSSMKHTIILPIEVQQDIFGNFISGYNESGNTIQVIFMQNSTLLPTYKKLGLIRCEWRGEKL